MVSDLVSYVVTVIEEHALLPMVLAVVLAMVFAVEFHLVTDVLAVSIKLTRPNLS